MVEKVAKYVNTRRFKKGFVFLGVFIGFLLLVAGIIPLFLNTHSINKEEYTFSPSGSNSGDPLNVTAHQSKSEQDDLLYTISNSSDPNNNTFSTVCPNDKEFKNTYQEILIENIHAFKSITFGDYDNEPNALSLASQKNAASFRIDESSYLESVSLYLSNDDDNTNSSLNLQVYNATWNNSGGYFEPDGQYKEELVLGEKLNNHIGWYTFSALEFYLNISQTEDNTFFIVLEDTNDDTKWYYKKDRDEVDNIDCLIEEGDNWVIKEVYFNPTKTSTIDFTLMCNFVPFNRTPMASEINLTINDKSISDLGEGKGIWNSYITYSILPESIDFILTSEWWDVSCNITKILVNYTRTDLKAKTIYNFDNSQNAVQWNATLGSFNGFDRGFSTYWISFTVPETWENPTAFNASEPITGNTQLGPLKNGYREFQIYLASNGTNWYITADVSRLETNVNIISKPEKIQAGNDFELTFYVTYFNGSDDVPFQGVVIAVETYINNELDRIETSSTDEQGIAIFRIFVPNDADSVYLTVELPETIDYTSTSFQITDISILNPSSPPVGLNLIELLPIFIIIGVVGSAGIGAAGVYKVIIIPKKRKQENTFEEIKTIFDDAINMEYILVIYKESGLSIYFKSMGLENVDPDLISGFISAVSSFGEKIDLQESLTEMKYEDKSLLLSDGKYIRVGIVLSKRGSELMRYNLKQFVEEFEERYADILPDWKSSLIMFRDAGDLIDKIFNTSIILPHTAKFNLSDIKNLEYSVSKSILYEADILLDEPGRDYFFIGKLLSRMQEATQKEVGEIFLGIKELREKGLLIPHELSEIGEQGNFCRDENKKNLKTIFKSTT